MAVKIVAVAAPRNNQLSYQLSVNRSSLFPLILFLPVPCSLFPIPYSYDFTHY
ncbi:hypothetical protein PL9214290179 [Planktothrix tepida PCC 9214]|uniref:Uncharacterized protein n=1 Tax=Planktothrix tepida PCC 9214 TaxID=671072 RepID=A0A1J1LDC0_9CYAN|nr:hypothetical protein PL9214290179 [Planktothrix tepida PCC 9214]